MAVTGIRHLFAAPGTGPGTAGGSAAGPATRREDLITVLLGACLIGGAMADGWAHANILNTLEGFFTPWHGLLYAGFAGTAGWTFWLAYQRRERAPYWWRDGWPHGYRLGALGVLIFFAGGLGDMVWHETLGVEAGLNAAFSPSHLLIVTGATLLLSSPLRSWWATGGSGLRAGTAVAAMTLAVMAPTIVLTHSSAFLTQAPAFPYDPGPDPRGGGPSAVTAIAGIDSYLVTTLLLTVPLLWVYRRRVVAGAGTTLTFGVAVFVLVMFEFPAPQTAGAVGALFGAAVADVLLLRLDARRGSAAPLRLPLAGALFAASVWTGHLIGLQVDGGLRWPIEMVTGIVFLTGVLGALLGGLAARPVQPRAAAPLHEAGHPDAGRVAPASARTDAY